RHLPSSFDTKRRPAAPCRGATLSLPSPGAPAKPGSGAGGDRSRPPDASPRSRAAGIRAVRTVARGIARRPPRGRAAVGGADARTHGGTAIAGPEQAEPPSAVAVGTAGILFVYLR